MVQYSTVQYSTVQYGTVQYSTVQYSTVQYGTVQHSTVQYSTVYGGINQSIATDCRMFCAQFCTQLMKAYVAKTSRNQLLLIDGFCYRYPNQDLFTSCHNVAMSLYNIMSVFVGNDAWD